MKPAVLRRGFSTTLKTSDDATDRTAAAAVSRDARQPANGTFPTAG